MGYSTPSEGVVDGEVVYDLRGEYDNKLIGVIEDGKRVKIYCNENWSLEMRQCRFSNCIITTQSDIKLFTSTLNNVDILLTSPGKFRDVSDTIERILDGIHKLDCNGINIEPHTEKFLVNRLLDVSAFSSNNNIASYIRQIIKTFKKDLAIILGATQIIFTYNIFKSSSDVWNLEKFTKEINSYGPVGKAIMDRVGIELLEKYI
jgi:hypothetical protein